MAYYRFLTMAAGAPSWRLAGSMFIPLEWFAVSGLPTAGKSEKGFLGTKLVH